MNTKAKFSFGMMALVAAGTVGFLPASADKGAPIATVTVMLTAVVEATPETPQDLVWDMTYGAERPVAIEAAAEAAADEGSIVDYTLG